MGQEGRTFKHTVGPWYIVLLMQQKEKKPDTGTQQGGVMQGNEANKN